MALLQLFHYFVDARHSAVVGVWAITV